MTGAVVWVTGLPASGKSTLALRLRDRLRAAGVAAVVLDGDAVRAALVPAPGYDPAGRAAFYSRADLTLDTSDQPLDATYAILRAAVRPQLGLDVRDVHAGRLLADEQVGGDLPVRVPQSEALQDVLLAPRQPEGHRTADGRRARRWFAEYGPAGDGES